MAIPHPVHHTGEHEGMKVLDVVTFVLLVVGGINWLLWGLFEFDLVAMIFGGGERLPSVDILAKIVYVIVGLSALYLALAISPILRRWHHGHSEYTEA